MRNIVTPRILLLVISGLVAPTMAFTQSSAHRSAGVQPSGQVETIDVTHLAGLPDVKAGVKGTLTLITEALDFQTGDVMPYFCSNESRLSR
jgi:hypothetical protein